MSILNYDQTFSFCGQNLSGISDLTFASNLGIGFTPTIGKKTFGFHKTGPSVGVVDFSRALIYADPVLTYTGESPCSGSFSYNAVDYGFESGYLTSYAVSCAVGQIPAISAAISVYGEMKTGVGTQTFAAHPDIFVPSPKSITISHDYASSNRVKSFDYSLSIPRLPKYSLEGGLFPDEVILNSPIQISTNATFDVGGFTPLDLQHFVRQISAPSFIITIKNRLSQTLMTLPVNNAQILNQEIQGTVDSPLALTLTYGGYLE